MVRLIIAASLCSGLVVAQTPRPKAADLLPRLDDLKPGYKLPWQLDQKIRRFPSEADWR